MAKSRPLLLNIGQGLSLMVGLPTIDSWKTSNRPKKATRGTFGFNLETNSLEYFNGSFWLESKMNKA